MKAILGLLALTFVVFFGSGNFGGRGGSGASSVVEVGDVNFTAHQVGAEFNQRLQQLSQLSGERIDAQDAIRAGLLDQTVNSLVTRTMFDLAADDLGVAVSDKAVETAIRELPAFRSATGQFDSTLLSAYLRQTGQSEAQFIAQVRNDLLRGQYLGSLRAGIAAPTPMVDALLRYRSEQRVADVVVIESANLEAPPAPDEAQLARFYEQYKERFRAPEFRTATVATLTPEAYAATVHIDDDAVASAYADRLAEFQQAERREVDQGLFLDRDAAEKAASLIAEGQSFEQAVESVSGLPPVSLGEVTRADLAEPALADAAFALDVGAVSEPVESPLGWHLLKVVSITPETTLKLSEVAEQLRKTLALERARDEIFDVLNDVEDGLAAGGRLEDVAAAAGLRVSQLEAFDARGRKRDGSPITLQPAEAIVTAVFEGSPGEPGDVVETPEGGFFIARVDEVYPPQIEPLERIRDRVAAAWLAEERSERAARRANELAEKARSGGDLEQLAREAGLAIERTEPFDRTGAGAAIAGPLITPLFAAEVGDVVQASAAGGAAVARLVEIREAGDGAAADREELRDQLAATMDGDLAQQLADALRERYTVDVDRAALEGAFLPQ